MEIATESTHWYYPDGKPCYEVEAVNGSGLRPTTLRDARKLGLVPSVTTITKILAAPGLTNWIIDQNIMAALTLPRHENELDSEFIWRIKEDGRAKATKAAERGTLLHTDIERAIQGKPHTRHQEHVRNVAQEMMAYNLELFGGSPEHSFAHPDGFGGKIDWHAGAAVADFKSKDMIEEGKKLVWDEHIIQLSLYAYGLGIERPSLYSVFVGIDDRKVHVHQWDMEDADRGLAMGKLLIQLWKLKNKI